MPRVVVGDDKTDTRFDKIHTLTKFTHTLRDLVYTGFIKILGVCYE